MAFFHYIHFCISELGGNKLKSIEWLNPKPCRWEGDWCYVRNVKMGL